MVTNFIIWNDNHLTDNFRLLFELLDNNPPESIKLKCYDDDRQGQPEKWVFEIVDKGYIDRADALLQTQITTNANNIQINANNIEINRQNIQANTIQLQDHEGRITNNTNDINVANGRITQNSSDINALNLRVGNNESEIENLKLFKQHPLNKVFNVEIGANYYRLHSYVTYLHNGKITTQIEIDFYTENGVNVNFELYTVLPWINLVTLSPYQIENLPCCGVEIPLNQVPTVTNHYVIAYDSSTQDVKAFVDSDLGTINQNGSATLDKMILNTKTTQITKRARGRIFLSLVCIY